MGKMRTCKCGQIIMFDAECDCEIRAKRALINAIKSSLSVVLVAEGGRLSILRDNAGSIRAAIPDGTRMTMLAKHVNIP